MHWRVDPIFFIRVRHDKYVTSETPETGNYFRIVPTAATARTLAGLNWVFKAMPNGAFVAVQKNIRPDGSAKVQTELRQGAFFTFLLYVNDPGILLCTPPYDSGSAPLPLYSGRTRLLYFDNLDDANQPDRLLLSREDKVTKRDFGSLVPNNFRIQAAGPSVTRIDFTEIKPGGAVVCSAQFSPEQRTALVDLPSGAFHLVTTPANGQEVLLADAELLDEKAIGIIRIYKDEHLNYDASVNYTIPFASV